ncbi:MAG: LysR family transcriptional regulator [Pseudomonadota bacterium]
MRNHLAPEIATFVRVVDLGSFAAVADEANVTSSGTSRAISRLEASLGAKLLHRTTRRLSLTSEGEAFLSHARAILATLEAAETDLSHAADHPRGHLRINCGTAFANHKLAPALPDFQKAYPEISVDLSVSDHRIDPLTEHADITIRVGALSDSDLIAVSLGTVSRVIAASPDYLAEHGTPDTPHDLEKHNCLLLSSFPHQATWPFIEDGVPTDIVVNGTFTSDSAETLLNAAISGAGIVRLGDFLGAKALSSGELVPLLTDTHVTNEQPITALVLPGRQTIPRVRAMLDFLKDRV